MLKWVVEQIDELESKYTDEAVVEKKKSGWVKLSAISLFEGFCQGVFIVGWISIILGVVNQIKKLFHRG